MIDGIMLVWFILTALSVAFVAFDIPKTPESVVLKWAFVILVVFTGPLGAFFYVLGCREPLAGTHAEYVSVKWRQVLGSTMHCAAGDGLGIIAGAALASFLSLGALQDFALEYALGFSFGWAYFQAFAMRDMYDGDYIKSLKATFLPELFSMNLLMAGMLPAMRLLMVLIEGAGNPLRLEFWFTMSMALIVGFAFAYPVNWWLVSQKMKHGMMTVIVDEQSHAGDHGAHGGGHEAKPHGSHEASGPSWAAILAMGAFSFACLVAGIALALNFEM
jgi:hypothetical protein